MRWNIPNILTVMRLLAAPGVPMAYVLFPSPMADWVALILFVGASFTDFLDGYLARKWNQISNFGRMLDPIADKVMVVIALLVVVSFSQMDAFILIPVVIILFREIFVSGLREFLGADASRLQVTKLAKWKTTVQMVAIAAILLTHMLGIYVTTNSFAMDQAYAWQVMTGEVQDNSNLYTLYQSYVYVGNAGIILIWLAALLTFITGFDYFRKALPFLKEET
ncbi:CDP-diacylglycerol--glycerol-3-phosphate 3-phosphatidyltransferase [Rhodobacterales bacterium 52_120_T64]|nr:CDP-diacylglycerol--glycerol-3-phosphate 3-phosphatidyltransferase [Rhodobacterales bacterium 52_120_T64]